MQNIDYSKLSEHSNLIVQTANQLARDSHYDFVDARLLLVAIVSVSKEMVRFILNKLNIDYSIFFSRLSEQLQLIHRFNISPPDYSVSVINILTNTINSYSRNDRGLVPPEALLLELSSGQNEVSGLFQEFGITNRRLLEAIEIYSEGNRINDISEENNLSLTTLERYAVNLRKKAEQGLIEPTIGRDDEIRRILQIISRKTKNNPLLLGEPGTGKTAIVEGLAVRLNRGDVPDDMKSLQIYSLDVATLIAGASMQGEFESRLKAIISEVTTNSSVILFIDEIHLLLGAGSGGGSMDAANILKPELARNGIKVIGATTFDEYNKFLESDQAFARRFQRVVIDEPTIDDSISILRGIKPRYEAYHKVKILDDAIVSAVQLSAKYVTDRFLPDKAIDILDETASRMRLDRSSVPSELDTLSRRVRQLEIERESLIQDGTHNPRITDLVNEISNLKARENELNAKWVNERRQLDKLQDYQNVIEQLKSNKEYAESMGRYDEAARTARRITSITTEQDALIQEISETESPILKLSLDSEDIKETVTNITGIPIGSLDMDEFEKMASIPQELKKSIKGQDHAVDAVCNVIRRSRLGLGNDCAPVGSFLFMGTTGVGKTEMAKALAESLFGSREMIVRIDMSEYQQEHSVSRLFGAPPGYIGYDQGGQLTESVRRRPYSVVLLDEIEKAHPKVFETLLQVLDDGRMTDGKGRVINFKNCIIIMTSNFGADLIYESDFIPYEELKQNLTNALKQRTSPEFVNRIDDIIIFNKLSESILASIAKKILDESVQQMINSGYSIHISDRVPIFIASKVDSAMGARPIKRFVSHLIIDKMIDKILSRDLSKDAAISIDICNDVLQFSNN